MNWDTSLRIWTGHLRSTTRTKVFSFSVNPRKQDPLGTPKNCQKITGKKELGHSSRERVQKIEIPSMKPQFQNRNKSGEEKTPFWKNRDMSSRDHFPDPIVSWTEKCTSSSLSTFVITATFLASRVGWIHRNRQWLLYRFLLVLVHQINVFRCFTKLFVWWGVTDRLPDLVNPPNTSLEYSDPFQSYRRHCLTMGKLVATHILDWLIIKHSWPWAVKNQGKSLWFQELLRGRAEYSRPTGGQAQASWMRPVGQFGCSSLCPRQRIQSWWKLRDGQIVEWARQERTRLVSSSLDSQDQTIQVRKNLSSRFFCCEVYSSKRKAVAGYTQGKHFRNKRIFFE